MQLKPQKIPLDILHSLPEGIKFVSKHGRDFLIVDKICCPDGHNLIDSSVRIHGEPTIRFTIDTGKSRGLVFVDAFWGGHAKLYAFVPELSSSHPFLKAFCPYCEANLITEENCRQDNCDCNKAIVLTLPGGKNKIFACAKLGCAGHHIEIVDIPKQISEEIDGINYFGSIDDDIFQGV